ncbi:MAG: NADH-quinone oxidoreductase subunit NuoE [Thermodesulfobacteriota bacterium]
MTDPFQPRHPDITEQMWEKIDAVIHMNRNKKGSVITVLRECQTVVGYLPVELMNHIAKNLHLSSSEVFGVASFYSLFSFVPKGRHTVKVCLGTACYVKGIKEVVSRISYEYKIKEGETTGDRRFSMEGVRCLGACGLAPVMVVDHDTHGAISADKVITILERYK